MDPLGITWTLVEGLNAPYAIASTPVTFDQYDSFCKATGYKQPIASFGRGKQPVINVNVADALALCAWLSKKMNAVIRLPKEAEWEYAARGGRRSKRYEYSGSNTVDDVAWHSGNSGNTTHVVASKKPNELGIYDMSGNVWEWCGTEGAIRGGSWSYSHYYCRISARDDDHADNHSKLIGFRLLKAR